MRHNDGIPFPCGDASEQPFPVLFGEICLVRHKNIGIGVELIKFVPPLVQQMVGNDNHGLGEKAHASGFHHRGDAGQRFSRAYNMVEQCRTFLNAAPDSIFLMGPELHFRRRAHQFKMGAVIARRDVRIEAFVVERGQHIPPVVVRPNPIKEGLADFIGLLHGGSGQLLINHHDRFAVVIVLTAFFFYLDGLVCQQRFDNLVGGVFRNTPDTCTQ